MVWNPAEILCCQFIILPNRGLQLRFHAWFRLRLWNETEMGNLPFNYRQCISRAYISWVLMSRANKGDSSGASPNHSIRRQAGAYGNPATKKAPAIGYVRDPSSSTGAQRAGDSAYHPAPHMYLRWILAW
jgi:hypothetical protein